MPRNISSVLFLAWLVAAAVTLGGCKTPTKEQMASVDYGPQPGNYQQLVREYLKKQLADPDSTILEFKAGPKLLYQQSTILRPQEYGWGVCVVVKEKNSKGSFERPYPMGFYIRDGKVVAANGGSEDDVVGWRFARDVCAKLGYTF